jgi:hypothetical protein
MIWVNFVVALLCGLVYIRTWGDFQTMIFTDPCRKIFESKHNKISYKNTQMDVSQCTLDFESRFECRLECREYYSIHIVDSIETML